jgi:DNA repair protein RecO (recombination protein O)
VDAHLALREDLVRVGYAAYVIELLDRFTYEEGENTALYRLLAETLQRLDRELDSAFCVRYYEMRLLDLVGFRPRLQQCMRCEQQITAEDQFFSAELGGTLCPTCGPRVPGSRPVSVGALRVLRHLQRSSYAEAHRLPLSPTVDSELESLMQHYLTYILERGLNTPAFLRRVRSTAHISDTEQNE